MNVMTAAVTRGFCALLLALPSCSRERFCVCVCVSVCLLTRLLLPFCARACAFVLCLCARVCLQFGDLRDVVQTCQEKKFPLRDVEMYQFGMQVAAGLAFMAGLRYIHMSVVCVCLCVCVCVCVCLCVCMCVCVCVCVLYMFPYF